MTGARWQVVVWSRRGGRGGWYWRIDGYGANKVGARSITPRLSKDAALEAAKREIDRLIAKLDGLRHLPSR